MDVTRFLLCTTAPLCLAVSAAAQQAAPPPEEDIFAGLVPVVTQSGGTALDPIVVGSGTDNVASDTPQSVSVISAEQIAREQPTTINDLFTSIPGVTAVGSERVLGQRVNIRGIGSSAEGDQNRLITRIDGVVKFYEQYRMGAIFTDPDLYRRIEVLRGPASSTLTGAGAVGGVIELQTREAADFLSGPEDDFGGRQKLSFGTNGNEALSSTVLAFRPAEGLEFLTAFTYRERDNYEDGDGEEVVGTNFDATAVLLKGRYSFGEGMAHSVFATYQNWASDAKQAEYAQTETFEAFGRVDRDVDDSLFVLGYDYNPPENDLIDLEVRLGYSDTEVIQENATNPLGIPSSLFEDAEYGYESWQLNVMNTSFLALGGTEVTLAYGFDASRQERVGEATSRKFPTTPPNGFIAFQPGGEDENIAVFAQAEIVTPFGLTIIPGLRYEWETLTPADNNTSFGAGDKVENEAFAPKIALLYEVTDAINVFGTYARTERLPVLDEVYDGSSGNLDLVPEKAETWEVGLSYSALDVFQSGDQLVGKLTYFDTDVENLIARATTSDPFVNIDDATYKGWELEVAYDSDLWFGSLAYARVRADGTDDGGPREPLEGIPADEVSVTLGTRLDRYDLELGVTGTYTWEQDRVPTGDETTDSYQVVDLFATWVPPVDLAQGVEVRLAANNIFDEAYKPALYLTDNARGRNISVSLALAF
ncbi:TonB-dependent heme/hemoglobin receptor family protein [Dinoroseobacter shibae DFL 12 = DSM 16493]|jgi:hemoglobin/transferrin/lactoferrin receptor protein|uniref:TonB-dependent heme/hemoglobin receptor family protein n=1 Tax=Dinoroseobacter shibae (strain DSM 16493 / NCIMB 14021 / DFL 12) TaxID=398580 RepID=A8LSE5_DINSH|nr:TonB-dependent receptor [Dinoroseobacter shibae]ABV92759.1 TonB-dependent heme/hemoglobin receptor family protein [Dinoroseobacter shibae DFL 12 = DSM 16493]URF47702.1 TonB-dependent receptor [Dinoroseobacter shibae]URF52012.1 TonB-dependent receptor [Dinoroseobacter shibae]